MLIQNCTFKRTEKGKLEQGILFDEGRLIIDMDCTPVKAPIWSFNARTDFVITVPDTRKTDGN